MAETSFQNLKLFEDTSDERDEALRLNSAFLLEQLQSVKAAESNKAVRRAIFDLKESLRDSSCDIHLVAEDAAATEFSRAYLFDELDQIAESLTLERARYYTDRLLKSILEVRTSAINDINLNRWKEYDDILTDSLWLIDRRDSTGVHTAGYWGNFIPQIPHQLMRRYTKRGDWVIDTFAGSGTTLIEGQRLGRNVVGIELQAPVAERTKHLIEREPNRYDVVSEIVNADSSSVDYMETFRRHNQKSAQLVIMHPPYFDIIKFSDDARDLSNAPSVDTFLAMMGQVVDNVAPLLDRGRYLALVIGDKYAKGDWIPLGFQTMSEVLKRSFSLKSIIVKNFEETTGKRNQKELWRYRALVGGFYIFKHEYIFLFKKQ